jgi:DNA-binding NarL/FixJ family response regulator
VEKHRTEGIRPIFGSCFRPRSSTGSEPFTLTVDLENLRHMQYTPRATSQPAVGERMHAFSPILVVDDDPAMRKLLSSLLDQAGFPTRTAATGEEALAAARREQPRLVLLDVCLPGVCGYEVQRELRDQFGEELPIVFISGERIESFDRAAGLLLGADDYVVKPFAPDELIARVRRLVARSTRPEAGTDRPKLTGREGEVMRLLANGLRQHEIAKELVISPKTVASHIEHILAKLGVHSRAEAVAVAHRSGLFERLST